MMNKKMLRQAQQLQKNIMKAQEELENSTVEATAGGGVVKAIVSGKMRLESLTIDPDAVYVIMGEELMASIAIDIMNAGKHVFIEKPAGASPEESQQLLDAAVANGVHCMVGYQRRFSAMTRSSVSKNQPSSRTSPTTPCAVRRFSTLNPHWGSRNLVWNMVRTIKL